MTLRACWVTLQVAVKAHKPTGAALLPVYAAKGELLTHLKLLDQAFSYLDKAVDVCNRNFGAEDVRTAKGMCVQVKCQKKRNS